MSTTMWKLKYALLTVVGVAALVGCGAVWAALDPQYDPAPTAAAAADLEDPADPQPATPARASAAPQPDIGAAVATLAGLLPPPWNVVAAAGIAVLGTNQYHKRKRPTLASKFDDIQKRIEDLKKSLDLVK